MNLNAATLAVALILSGTSTVALSATYGGPCSDPACDPFTTNNSYVWQYAVSVAAANGAVVGDSIALDREAACGHRYIGFNVIDSPVLNSTDLEVSTIICDHG